MYDNCKIVELELELTEARAEIARLREQLDMLTITANLEQMRALMDEDTLPRRRWGTDTD